METFLSHQSGVLTVLVTGATGFVGRALVPALAERGHAVRSAVRRAGSGLLGEVAVGEIGPETDWSAALQGVDVVIHLAARVHVMQDTAADPLAAFRRVNTDGTERLARQAAEAGVRRLVLVSSIKVNGERAERPFTELDPPRPEDPYGISKAEAEAVLRRVAEEAGLEAVVVRPPLVYGPGVGGNFARLLALVERGLPLPLGAVDNRRSLVGRCNLVDFLVRCAEHPAAAGETFLVSDGEDLSTAELIRRLARALDRPVRLWPVPPALLYAAGRVTGRTAVVERLCGSLQIDSRKGRERLGWAPPATVEEELARTAAAWRAASTANGQEIETRDA